MLMMQTNEKQKPKYFPEPVCKLELSHTLSKCHEFNPEIINLQVNALFHWATRSLSRKWQIFRVNINTKKKNMKEEYNSTLSYITGLSLRKFHLS